MWIGVVDCADTSPRRPEGKCRLTVISLDLQVIRCVLACADSLFRDQQTPRLSVCPVPADRVLLVELGPVRRFGCELIPIDGSVRGVSQLYTAATVVRLQHPPFGETRGECLQLSEIRADPVRLGDADLQRSSRECLADELLCGKLVRGERHDGATITDSAPIELFTVVLRGSKVSPATVRPEEEKVSAQRNRKE